jgi:hypothetical protein
MCTQDCYTAFALLARRAPLDLLMYILYHTLPLLSIPFLKKVKKFFCELREIFNNLARPGTRRPHEKAGAERDEKKDAFAPSYLLLISVLFIHSS